MIRLLDAIAAAEAVDMRAVTSHRAQIELKLP